MLANAARSMLPPSCAVPFHLLFRSDWDTMPVTPVGGECDRRRMPQPQLRMCSVPSVDPSPASCRRRLDSLAQHCLLPAAYFGQPTVAGTLLQSKDDNANPPGAGGFPHRDRKVTVSDVV